MIPPNRYIAIRNPSSDGFPIFRACDRGGDSNISPSAQLFCVILVHLGKKGVHFGYAILLRVYLQYAFEFPSCAPFVLRDDLSLSMCPIGGDVDLMSCGGRRIIHTKFFVPIARAFLLRYRWASVCAHPRIIS